MAVGSQPTMDALMAGYVSPGPDEFERLEADVAVQLADPEADHLKLLGYGEFTIAVAHPRAEPRWACKRLPPSGRAAADRFAEHIERYVRTLTAAGIRVVPTEVRVAPASGGGFAVYMVQPILPKASLATNVLAAREPDPDDAVLSAVLDAVVRGVQPAFGVDAQLANWAWLGGEPWYLDISTPFTQGPDDRPELDVELLIRPYPGFFRPILRRWVAPPLLVRYYDLRLTLLEFCGILRKDGLAHWTSAAIEACNRRLPAPMRREEVEKVYADDVSLFGFIYAMKRLERRIQRLSGRTYQFLISPPLDRAGKGGSAAERGAPA